jgi:hypothetical protein
MNIGSLSLFNYFLIFFAIEHFLFNSLNNKAAQQNLSIIKSFIVLRKLDQASQIN